MRNPLRLGLLLAGLLTGLLAVPSHAASVEKSYVVPTRHGYLYVEVAHPTVNGTIVKTGSVLTYSPYYGSLGSRLGDAGTWNAAGLARVNADVVGTGNSGGCYDYGGKREKESVYDLVEWIAKQPWSNGKVGMIGGSYDGTTAMAAAVMRPPHLTTIVPEAAISRWYDYAYSGGMRYSFNNERMGNEDPGLVIDEQGFDTPLAFDYGIGTLPPQDVGGEHYAERVQSTTLPCDELKHVQNGYQLDPDYDAFWVERDYAKDAGKVTIPVLVALNWGDWNVKQETGIRFWQGLTHSRFRRLAAGTRWEGHGTPRGEYKSLRVEWMQHFLLGARNGVDKTPAVMTQPSDSKKALAMLSGPVPKTTGLTLYTQETKRAYPWALLPSKAADVSVRPYAPSNTASESGLLAHARQGGDGVWFESPPLKRDLRIFGSPTVSLWSSTQRTWVTYAVSVVDIDPAFYSDAGGQRVASQTNALLGVTRGWLDSRYRKSLAKREEWKPGSNGVTLVAKPQDYVFRKGHAIGLLVSDVHTEWVVPKPYDGAPAADPLVYVETPRTSITLPVVGLGNAKTLF